jgi:hypothetical protein
MINRKPERDGPLSLPSDRYKPAAGCSNYRHSMREEQPLFQNQGRPRGGGGGGGGGGGDAIAPDSKVGGAERSGSCRPRPKARLRFGQGLGVRRTTEQAAGAAAESERLVPD